MSFSFPPLKLPNKKREEYSKMIIFIPFHSLIPNKALKKVLHSQKKKKKMEKYYEILLCY